MARACRIVVLEGVHSVTAAAWLADCAGMWIGTNGFRLMPSDRS